MASSKTFDNITQNTRCVAIFRNKKRLDRVDFYLWCLVTTKKGVQPSPLILMDDGGYEAAVNIPGYLRPVDSDATLAEIKRECSGIKSSDARHSIDELEDEEEDDEDEEDELEEDEEDELEEDEEEPEHVRPSRR